MPHVSHTRLDLGSFSQVFPLTELRERARQRALPMPGGQLITSPFHLTVTELLRREALGGSLPTGATPADVFVFGVGEPLAPYLTKVGGVPFRSRRKAWPTTNDGRPLGFLGQVCFLDSTDLVADLPGDVLLIFVDPDNALLERAYVCEWAELGDAERMSSGEMPNVTYTWRPGLLAEKRGVRPELRAFDPLVCHGIIHRTVDLPGHTDLFGSYAHPDRVAVLEATKIGGVPYCVQRPTDAMGRFVASVASVQPAPDVPYPWVNDAAPIGLSVRHRLRTWKLGDSGSLHIFEERGRVRVDPQSY